MEMEVESGSLINEIMLYLPPPENYSSVIGTLLLLVAIAFLSFTLSKDNRSHATKVFAILLVSAISLFSAHWTTYFAAIFIVATAVTELEFLQSLAAIIRKDKNYFDYRKEVLSREENIKRKAGEVAEDGLAVDNLKEADKAPGNEKIDLSSLPQMGSNDMIKLSIEIERKALDRISDKVGRIERNIRLRKEGVFVELDGMIPFDNEIFEVKWVKNPSSFIPYMSHSIRLCTSLSSRYYEITGHKPRVNLVVVLNSKDDVDENKKLKFMHRARESGFNLVYFYLSDLGFDVASGNP